MPSAHALQLLLDHARRERDDALAALQRSQSQEEQAQAQATQLEQYRAEYQSRLKQQFAASAGGIELMHSYRGFMQRLDLAIGQQVHALAQARARVKAARDALVAREQRLAAVDKLIERRRAGHEAEQARREQRRLDEAAQRWRGPGALHGNPPTTY